ncbi:MAG: hypothetical protein M3R38_31035 [Actinomycetota bacterium]|nr:hypothetical protein [Actinomycetota bacterium]
MGKKPNKFMLLAAMLAMVLLSSMPAFAQSVTFEDDGDDFEQGDDATNQSVESSQYTVADFGDQNASIEQNVNGDDNQTGAAIGQNQRQSSDQTIQNALADYGSGAFNSDGFDFDGFFEDEDFDGIEDDSDVFVVFNNSDNDGFHGSDFDGVADVFDAFFVFGDFNIDGFNDEFEISSAAAASAAASGGSAAASAAASSN